LKQGVTVVELGAAPGGWSQSAAEIVGDSEQVIACDILPMNSLSGVSFCRVIFVKNRYLMHC